MKTCGQCIYWKKVPSIKDFGECNVEVPPWIYIDEHDAILHKDVGLANSCPYFREEQDDDIH